MNPHGCRHYEGFSYPVEPDGRRALRGVYACAAGLDVAALTGGPLLGFALRIPCTHAPGSPGVASCARYSAYTADELATRRAAALKSGAQSIAALEAVLLAAESQAGLAPRGTVPCPRCGQPLAWTASRRAGRVDVRSLAGRCSTPGCLSFMT
jgi:hypothetical protein